MRVAVIGGGVAGLTTALAFAKQGASVVVYEQAPALTEVGAGLQITPNGARVLAALGVTVPGIRAAAVVPMDGLSGRAVTRFALETQKPPYRFVHRAALIAALAGSCAAAGVDMRLGHTVTTPPPADLVVGAEGLRSALRARLNGAAEPFFTGQVAWRALIALPDATPPEARIWMLPGQHVVTYPLEGGRLNIVAVQERAAWADEGWTHADDPANLRAAFAEACPDLRAILAQVDQVGLWGLFRHPVARVWARDGIALVGDAAHPTLPFLAQGANLALEDGYVLAQCLSRGAPDKALRRYQSLRAPRVTQAIAMANANAVNYHLRGLRRRVSLAALRGIGAVAPGAFISRLDWLYGHDVTRLR